MTVPAMPTLELKKGFEILCAPTQPHEVEWRMQSAGVTNGKLWCRVVPYIRAVSARKRMDTAFRPMNWQREYVPVSGGVVCRVGIRHLDGRWVWKADGAQFTDRETVKGACSDAFKRAVVAWGGYTDLYESDPVYAQTSPTRMQDWEHVYSVANKYPEFWWNPPIWGKS